VPEVLTLGVKPNFADYTDEEKKLILNAAMILYPTANYAQFFTTLGKPFFPSLETCLYADEKIKQTTLFSMLGIPHPRTRVYYRLHHQDILRDFSFPFVAKLPRASSRGRGVYKIEDSEQLNAYLRLTSIAYIQEYLPHPFLLASERPFELQGQPASRGHPSISRYTGRSATVGPRYGAPVPA
jgi:ribosomal protein S6--L-glutamate ligase